MSKKSVLFLPPAAALIDATCTVRTPFSTRARGKSARTPRLAKMAAIRREI